jgi:hypothetical protein
VDSETSVTAQIPIAALRAPADEAIAELAARVAALTTLLVAKGLVTEAELAQAIAARAGPVDPPDRGTDPAGS